jgi:hypothetical protein
VDPGQRSISSHDMSSFIVFDVDERLVVGHVHCEDTIVLHDKVAGTQVLNACGLG